jgi:hypothetical protein
LVAKKPWGELNLEPVIGRDGGSGKYGPDRQHIGGMGGDDRDRCLSSEGSEIVPPSAPDHKYSKVVV